MQIIGRVASQLVNVGSKSEKTAYVIETGDETISVYASKDNPFTNKTFRGLLGRTVTAVGEFDGDLFVATSVKPLT